MKVIPGTTSKPISSSKICEFFNEKHSEEGIFYTGYPVIGTTNGPFPIDSLLLSEKYGVVIINLIEGKDISGYEDKQDESYNKMEAKLKNYKELTKRKKLIVPINVITFAPVGRITGEFDPDYPLFDHKSISEIFERLEEMVQEDFQQEDFQKVTSVIQSISTVRKSPESRKVVKENSKGSKLKKIEDSIANLDGTQSRAVIETVEGVQRIRGLAGSGKTVILALKAAYLHAQHPDWEIAVTFNTRALKNQLKKFIEIFYIEQTNQYPNWNNLHILQAWGAPGGGESDGIYYQFCKFQEVDTYRDFRNASNQYGYNNAFSGACQEALENMSNSKNKYDVMLVDEAQDFSKYFFRICYHLLKTPKRLVYAYDELQSLSGNSLSSPEELFGKDEAGQPLVRFDSASLESQDIVLESCYRNPRPVLVTAHALGFGIYRETDERTGTGLVQMFDNKDLWEDVGYQNELGSITKGNPVKLKRNSKSSPRFLESHSSIDDIIQFVNMDSDKEQIEWVVSEIEKNINEDELLARDIIVINPDPKTTKFKVSLIRSMLFNKGINSHIAGVANPDEFYENNDSVTFTGIYRAKGNEAAMVYVINGQDCYQSFGSLQTVRNRLFTAITRSKAWVRVIGVGEDMVKLTEEFEKVKEKNFTLDFCYPTEEQLANIKTINRDMSDVEKQEINRANESVEDLIASITAGKMSPSDIAKLEDLMMLVKNSKSGEK
ncbi:DEAD/DEAH box helicase [Lactococcus lactis]|uniref:Superfamily I DNA and RNA helicases n=1 Tax=Lactococcus lactis subsp. lactis TaxID=1360 RepID=A0A0V8DXV9_LACLL|nr:ATP-binding domain-containing protein [Lactococcus lactis]KSU18372.1 Superfamily I DNA and RNA helicases [Lactococcus lactis subsp. lactis]